MNQPCPDCGTLMLPDGEQAFICPACGHKWTAGQIKLLYAIFADDTEEMSIYNFNEDGSYYDDDYDDYDDYDNYYQTWGWRYRLRDLRDKFGWWFWRQFKRCHDCHKLNRNCTCIPF